MDYLIRAIDEDRKVKVSVVKTNKLVEKARLIHGLSKTASAAFGRALTAGVMMTDNLKNEEDYMTLNIKGNGPLGRIIVTGKNNGKIKGYVDNPLADADIRESDGKLDVGKIVGNKGTITVVMDLGLKEPYVGNVPLVSGEIAEDLANYFYTSDQVKSVVSLGILIDKDYSVNVAGGFILQLMPGAGEDTIDRLENNLKNLPSMTSLLKEGNVPEDILNKLLKGMNSKILDKKEVSFECDCSIEKVSNTLTGLNPKEIKNIIEDDGKAEIKCYFCNKKYDLNIEDLEEIYNKTIQYNS